MRIETITWTEGGRSRTAPWHSATVRPPRTVLLAEDLRANRAAGYTSNGVGLLWRGDFRRARQLLAGMTRRLDRRREPTSGDPAARFYRHRQARQNRTKVLGMVLVELDDTLAVPLPGAPPDSRTACRGIYAGRGVVPLRELLSAEEWHRRGVYVPGLGARIHPHHGVFSPTRGDYVDLIAGAELPDATVAFDIGTGTGVLAALLAKRGVPRVIATDLNPAAVTCARENMRRLGLADRVTVTNTDLFPPGRADLVVCNPPWLPGTPRSIVDSAVFDEKGRMLSGFLTGVADHLTPGGQAWLVLSNLAELLNLRTRTTLLDQFIAAGLKVLDRREIMARNGNRSDPLADLRAAERISLWCLTPA